MARSKAGSTILRSFAQSFSFENRSDRCGKLFQEVVFVSDAVCVVDCGGIRQRRPGGKRGFMADGHVADREESISWTAVRLLRDGRPWWRTDACESR